MAVTGRSHILTDAITFLINRSRVLSCCQSEDLLKCVTVMMQQRAMFDFLLHVIQLYGLIFASCDDEPLTGCHGCYGCCVGMMCEVSYGCPLLMTNRGTQKSYTKKANKVQKYMEVD